MYVGAGDLYNEWQSTLINDEMVLAAEFAAVGGIGASKRAAVGGMARWPSPHWRAPNGSGRIRAFDAAWPSAGAAKLRPVANRAVAANTSFPSRIQVLAANTPKEYLSSAQTECRSVPHGH
jgi:hypothetical protein